jgi:hypothetical protein
MSTVTQQCLLITMLEASALKMSLFLINTPTPFLDLLSVCMYVCWPFCFDVETPAAVLRLPRLHCDLCHDSPDCYDSCCDCCDDWCNCWTTVVAAVPSALTAPGNQTDNDVCRDTHRRT